MLNKIKNLFTRTDNDETFMQLMDEIKAIKEEAAECKLVLDGTAIRLEARITAQEALSAEQQRQLDSHNQRLKRLEIKSRLSETGTFLLDVIAGASEFQDIKKRKN